MTATPLVQASGVSQSFQGTTVLEGIDLAIAQGEILAVVGPNGGGKSTLLFLLGGLLRPTRGSITIGGIAAHQVATARTGSVGLITADHGVYPLLTGRENLTYFGGLFGLGASEVIARAQPLLEQLDLVAHLDTRTGLYSSGMRQKLSLVRATFQEPQLLLLDEPTANLDPLAAGIIHAAVEDRARKGSAVVLVTHDLHAAAALASRVLFVDGRVLHVSERPRIGAPTSELHALYQKVMRR